MRRWDRASRAWFSLPSPQRWASLQSKKGWAFGEKSETIPEMSCYSLQSALFRLENDADWGSISAARVTAPSSKSARVGMMLKSIWKTTKSWIVFWETCTYYSVFPECSPRRCDIYKSACWKLLNRNNTKHSVLGIWPGSKGEGGDPNKTHQQGRLGVNQYVSLK